MEKEDNISLSSQKAHTADVYINIIVSIIVVTMELMNVFLDFFEYSTRSNGPYTCRDCHCLSINNSNRKKF